MKHIWQGLTRTDYDLLKYLTKKEASLATSLSRRQQTIDNRHLDDSQELANTIGAELDGIRARIAEIEAKKQPEVAL